MADNVYPIDTVVTFHDGVKVRLVRDEPWSANDPLVKARPDLFDAEPQQVRGTIEQATAAPGETRRTKRAAQRG